MPRVELITEIKSTREICFDLARSIDLHRLSTHKTNEEAIAGKTSGLIEMHDTVTWRATHFGIRQQLTSKITAFEKPTYFRDEQIKGAFASMKHDHLFKQVGEIVIMTDIFEFQSPFGIFGKIFNELILTSYMRKFLIERNNIIKEYAESGKWKKVLNV